MPPSPSPPNTSKPTPLPKSVPNKELFQRISFLYQANIFLDGLGSVPGVLRRKERAETGDGASARAEGQSQRQGNEGEGAAAGETLGALARSGTKTFQSIAKHTMLKIDPVMKRSICKSCQTILIPGLTSRVRINKSPSHLNKITTTCLTCLHPQSIPCPPTPTPILPTHSASTSTTTSAQPPAPPNLAVKPKTLDGPVRAAKRARGARRVPFHQREEGRAGAEGGGGGGGGKKGKPTGGAGASMGEGRQGGHGIWVEGEVVENWGTRS